MRKILVKSIIAIAAISAISACSSIDLYPSKQEVQPQNQNKYSQIEVILTEKDSQQTEVLVYNLVKDRLEKQSKTGEIGNKQYTLDIAVENCAICTNTDMQVSAKIRTNDLIKITSVESSEIEVIEIPSIHYEPMVDKSDKKADTTPVPVTAVKAKDSLTEGEEIIEVTPNVEAKTIEIQTPVKPQVSSEFSKPEKVKPFLYRTESEEVNHLFSNLTHMKKIPLHFEGDKYTDLISDKTINKEFNHNNGIPVSVKVRLIEVPPLNLKK